MNEHDLLDAVGGIDPKYVNNAAKKKAKKQRRRGWMAIAATMAAALVVLVGVAIGLRLGTGKDEKPQKAQGGREGPSDPTTGIVSGRLANAAFSVDYDKAEVKYTPSVASYQAKADLSNVKDADRYSFSEKLLKKLVENNFVVYEGQSSEFFEIYETNRYGQVPNFITADSMMHTYHLYFAMLQKKVEKGALCGAVEKMSAKMLENSKKQYEVLKGSEWEEAAKLNVAYFGIATRLLGLSDQIPDYASSIVDEELRKIMAASGINTSLITGTYEDYSQFKPRGYYEGDAQLEKYFRAMMLFGRINYVQESDTMNRCALLITMAMKEDEASKKEWANVYDVTAFLVGQSDDLSYFEYLPVIEKAYGKDAAVKDLIGNSAAFENYVDGILDLRIPEINSVVFEDDGGATDKRLESKGFRFMGQRFTLDEAVFTQLTYSRIKEASDGSARMLPDGLDVPAAMGSDLALDILIEKGNDKYPNYLENMEKVRGKVQSADEYWSSTVYGGWLYTLMPLLAERGEGYPSFMTNENWQKKSLEGYLASWTELKHDTILYAKQIIAEMGGDDDYIYDDRGYVEPQPELYSRLYALTKTTMDGLGKMGYLGKDEKEGLQRLGELAQRLRDISVKELQNEKLTDDDYELIRDYGGSLEHLWYDTVKDEGTDGYADAAMFPMSLIADVATDPNGTCLEEAIGGAARIYVIFPIDGELHIGIGGVFNYYQFEQPISDRMTDSEWRIKLGQQVDDDGWYHGESVQSPEWTDSYRHYWKDNGYEY